MSLALGHSVCGTWYVVLGTNAGSEINKLSLEILVSNLKTNSLYCCYNNIYIHSVGL